ncbi:MAG: hypothetical protein C3F15_14465 [Holophagae bacterium]|nr:MAG: hypothetical protein C3F15_14465 [Holophagae bacterium]
MAPTQRKVLHRGRAAAGVRALLRAACLLGIAASGAAPISATAAELRLPDGIVTHADGRLPLQQLAASWLRLVDAGWQLDLIAESKPPGTTTALPIVALRSPTPGAAVWILTGIHGEEPAGPNAVAAAIDDLAALGDTLPVVLLPLLNPHGYARNWRYLDLPTFSDTADGHSVGDSSHLLPDPAEPGRPRAGAASSPEADAVTRYVVRTSAAYPPLISIDLHEDDLVTAGYVYSQGELGTSDPLAQAAVAVLREHGIAIQLDGQTRFGETIVGGIIGPVTDSSIDELIGATSILVDGRAQAGPSAHTVLVFETPAKELPLDRRVAAHLTLLRRLAGLLAARPEL